MKYDYAQSYHKATELLNEFDQVKFPSDATFRPAAFDVQKTLQEAQLFKWVIKALCGVKQIVCTLSVGLPVSERMERHLLNLEAEEGADKLALTQAKAMVYMAQTYIFSNYVQARYAPMLDKIAELQA